MVRVKVMKFVLIMQKRFFLFLVFFVFCTLSAQNQRGYPEMNPKRLFDNFQNPPRGYGNVPFYWWQGDSLTEQRLSAQLDILSKAPIDGFSISYAHTAPEVDTLEAKKGYGFAGNTEPGSPALFSDKWWDILKWYAKECQKYGMQVGLDDYTFGWPNNGYYPDQIRDLPEMKNYKGKLKIVTHEVEGGHVFEAKLSKSFLTAVAWPGAIDLKSSIKSNVLKWKAPVKKSYKVYVISTESDFAIHPNHGEKLVDLYLREFERRLTSEELKGLNYFFQDELTYPLTMLTWSDDFPAEFMKRKNYDILPYLPALVDNIGSQTPKIRLDYSEVLVDLAEERYFEPIYNWHKEKGLIYGSDNHGRGKDPLAYVDYFRANGWYTAPGNDAPARGSSFIETKVSSSIAHLNKRPRTWLESFHSMGWGSSASWLREQIDHHFVAGGNLVCMHGLYYSTHGGWWEWAPPCFHFRMPYWEHMTAWLKYVERMSYILSQGTHVCDIALMYPSESMQAYPEAKAASTFKLALDLSEHGLDYDFIHFKPLREATFQNGYMKMAEEKYKVLVLSDIWACHHTTLQKTLEHFRRGGVVIATGRLPMATTLEGEHSTEVNKILLELFGDSVARQQHIVQTNISGGKSVYLASEDVVSNIRKLILPDFVPSEGRGRVLHRKIGDKDIYMLTEVPQNSNCFFRAKGNVELWNAFTGEKEGLSALKQDKDGTYLKMPQGSSQSYLVVFSKEKSADILPSVEKRLLREVTLSGEWEIEYRPTLDNTWGDYRLPASKECIGTETPIVKYKRASDVHADSILTDYQDSFWKESVCGYGIQAEHLALSSSIDFGEAVKQVLTERTKWNIYEFSWQYGVWDNPGPQGFHGLKSRVSNEFLVLNSGAHEFFKTHVWISKEGKYALHISGRTPDVIFLDGIERAVDRMVTLDKGWHSLVWGYSSTPHIDYRRGPFDFDPRQRSMLVVLPQGENVPLKSTMYDSVVSSSWPVVRHMMYSPFADKENRWIYKIETVPGVKEIELNIHGAIKNVWLAGAKIANKHLVVEPKADGANLYQIKLMQEHLSIETLVIDVVGRRGYQGAAVIPTPVKLICGKGKLEIGNWANLGSLRYYSGGMYYRKTQNVDMQKEDKVILDLGNVIATCEVKVNNQLVGVLVNPPYELDVTQYVDSGNNQIEVLVYSTLSNFYQAIPSSYRGEPDAGLLGPVKLKIKR